MARSPFGAQTTTDNDGVSNLLEYAIAGMDPTVSDPSPGTLTGNTLSFDKRQPLATDIAYAIEESTDLGVTDLWEEVAANGERHCHFLRTARRSRQGLHAPQGDATVTDPGSTHVCSSLGAAPKTAAPGLVREGTYRKGFPRKISAQFPPFGAL
jgi:hypothetical protein